MKLNGVSSKEKGNINEAWISRTNLVLHQLDHVDHMENHLLLWCLSKIRLMN